MRNSRRSAHRESAILRSLREQRPPAGWEGGEWRPNCRNFARAFEVSEKTIQRDLSALKDQGCLIEYEPESYQYVWTNPNELVPLPSLSATEDELRALLTAMATISTTIDLGTAHHLASFINKFEAQLPDGFTQSPECVGGLSTIWPEQLPLNRSRHWSTLQRAVLDEQCVRLVYRSPHQAEAREYTLEPLHLACLKGAWYLLARPTKAPADQRPLHFRVSRIQELKVLETRVRRPITPQELGEQIEFGVGAWQGGPRETVRLRIASDKVELIRELQWNSSATFSDLPNGDCELRLETTQADKLAYFVLQWAPAIEVLEPLHLRQIVLSLAQEVLRLHSVQP